MANRGNEVDPAEIYGDNYKQDNRRSRSVFFFFPPFFPPALRADADVGGKQLKVNKAAVAAPKPYGREGRGVEVKEADDYEDDLAAKMDRMLNRNKHTRQQDASAKGKSSCAGCSKAVTEDDKWVAALGKDYHVACFRCCACNTLIDKSAKYYDRGGRPACAKCEQSQKECPSCHKACLPEQAKIEVRCSRSFMCPSNLF